MPIYNAPLLSINQQEIRRYAGLRSTSFDKQLIADAGEEACLLAEPRGTWNLYAYDSDRRTVLDEKPFLIEGEKPAAHLEGAKQVIILAATVGAEIEAAVTRYFAAGRYAYAVLLDAAATTAVEQIADAMEKTIFPPLQQKGYAMRWRFSPGYGDWSLQAQPEMLRLSDAAQIGIQLTSSLMLSPRKSITAIIGLIEGTSACTAEKNPVGCAACSKTDCPARKK